MKTTGKIGLLAVILIVGMFSLSTAYAAQPLSPVQKPPVGPSQPLSPVQKPTVGPSQLPSPVQKPEGLTVALSITPDTVVGGGEPATGTITLSAPAPAGGMIVKVSSSPSNVAWSEVPAVFIPEGQTKGTFLVATHLLLADMAVMFTAGEGATARIFTLYVIGVPQVRTSP